jgi:hypothetical protein
MGLTISGPIEFKLVIDPRSCKRYFILISANVAALGGQNNVHATPDITVLQCSPVRSYFISAHRSYSSFI